MHFMQSLSGADCHYTTITPTPNPNATCLWFLLSPQSNSFSMCSSVKFSPVVLHNSTNKLTPMKTSLVLWSFIKHHKKCVFCDVNIINLSGGIDNNWISIMPYSCNSSMTSQHTVKFVADDAKPCVRVVSSLCASRLDSVLDDWANTWRFTIFMDKSYVVLIIVFNSRGLFWQNVRADVTSDSLGASGNWTQVQWVAIYHLFHTKCREHVIRNSKHTSTWPVIMWRLIAWYHYYQLQSLSPHNLHLSYHISEKFHLPQQWWIACCVWLIWWHWFTEDIH